MSDVTLSPQDLPPTWAITTLGTVVDYGRTSKAKPTEMQASDWILELEDIEKDSSRLLQRLTFGERQSKSTKSRFEAGDVLYGKLRPYLNKVLIADQPGYCTTEIIPIKSGKYLDSRYLFYWLKHPAFLAYVGAESHGMSMPRLGTDTGRAAPFVLAPRAEQTRIADQLDTLFARVNACNDHLNAIPGILKRFRQAVTNAACSGELSTEWRNSTDLVGWEQQTLAKVCSSITDGDHQAPPQTDSGVPFITISAINDGKLRLEKASRFVPKTYFDSLEPTRRPERGDLLFSVTGSIGIPAQVDTDAPFTFQRHIAILKPNRKLILSAFLTLVLGDEAMRSQVMAVATGTAQLTVPLGGIRSFVLKLPSLTEQTEIVRRVASLFAIADRIEARLTTARTLAQRLAPRVLAKAFRGELVSQDPSDEPASALLARITSERTIASTSPKNTAVRRPRAPRAAGATKETANMTKSRHDDDVKGKPYLADHLRRIGKAVTAEELFKAAELPIADFYKQLAWEVAQGHVTDGGDTLEARNAA